MIVKPKSKRELVALTAALNYANATPEQHGQLDEDGQVDVDRDALVTALEQLDAESHEDHSDYADLAARL
jgi:hypothetical protein